MAKAVTNFSRKYQKPVVSDYEDPGKFIKDWVRYSRISVRELSRELKCSSGYISSVIHGCQPLSVGMTKKISGIMGLTKRQEEFFIILSVLSHDIKKKYRALILKRCRK